MTHICHHRQEPVVDGEKWCMIKSQFASGVQTSSESGQTPGFDKQQKEFAKSNKALIGHLIKLGENEEYNSQLVKCNHVRDLQHYFSQISTETSASGRRWSHCCCGNRT